MRNLKNTAWKNTVGNPKVVKAPKYTRECNTPENADSRLFRESAMSGVLRFPVCFGALLDGEQRGSAKRNTPESADSRNNRLSAFSGVLRFRVCALSRENLSMLTLYKDQLLLIGWVGDQQWDDFPPPQIHHTTICQISGSNQTL